MTSAIPPGPRRTAAPSRSAPRFPGTPGTAPPRCRTPPVRDVAASPVPTPPAFPPSRCGPAPRTGAGAGGAPGGAEQHSVGEQQPQPRCRRGPGPAPTAHGERQLGRVPPSHPERPRRPRPRRAASRPRRDGTGPPPNSPARRGLPRPLSPPPVPVATPASPAVPRAASLPGTPNSLVSLPVPTHLNISIFILVPTSRCIPTSMPSFPRPPAPLFHILIPGPPGLHAHPLISWARLSSSDCPGGALAVLPGCARSRATHGRQLPEKLSLSVKPSLGVSCRVLCSQHQPLAAGTGSSQPSPGRHQPPHRDRVGLGEALHGSGVGESVVSCSPGWDVPKLVEPRAQSPRLLILLCAVLWKRQRPQDWPGCV